MDRSTRIALLMLVLSSIEVSCLRKRRDNAGKQLDKVVDSETCNFGDVVGKGGHCKSTWRDVRKDRMMFFGDSDIELWNTEHDFPDAVNCGVGGATAWEAAQWAEQTAKKYRPKDFVIFVSGENDFGYGASSGCVNDIFSYFKTAVQAFLASKHKPKVVYISTKPEPGTKNLHALYEQYDRLIKDYAASLDGRLIYIDSYAKFKEMGNPAKLYDEDDLHLSKHGYSWWTKWLKTAIDWKGSECNDISGWVDSDGDTCEEITDNGWCEHAKDYAVNGVSALEACCGCGGGKIQS